MAPTLTLIKAHHLDCSIGSPLCTRTEATWHCPPPFCRGLSLSAALAKAELNPLAVVLTQTLLPAIVVPTYSEKRTRNV